MTIGRTIVAVFIFGFGSIFGIWHILWGISRYKIEEKHKPISWSFLNFDKMDYETAPAIQLILLGVFVIIGVAVSFILWP